MASWTIKQHRETARSLEDIRLKVGLNKTYFVRELGTSLQQYEKWRLGRIPGIQWLFRIEKILTSMEYDPEPDPNGMRLEDALNLVIKTRLKNITAMCRSVGIAQMTYHNWVNKRNTPHLEHLEATVDYINKGYDKPVVIAKRQDVIPPEIPWTLEELYDIVARLTALRSRFRWSRKDLDLAVGCETLVLEHEPHRVTLNQALRLRDFILRHTTVRSDNARLRFRRRGTPGKYEVVDTMAWLPFMVDIMKAKNFDFKRLPHWCTEKTLEEWADGEDPNLFLILVIRRELDKYVPSLQKQTV